jgi:mannose-6-phosphate isomerase-like protein (cupin superfamily)
VHRAFDRQDDSGSEVSVVQSLDWVSSSDEVWIDETRTLHFHSADIDDGIWALDFTTTLTNVHHEPLELGSPTTHGRPNAGYTGLFWRGPRAWTGADVIADGGHEGDAVMGTQGAWAAITGEHDGGATVLAYAGTTSAAVPLKWFARSSAFACLNPSPAFDSEIKLERAVGSASWRCTPGPPRTTNTAAPPTHMHLVCAECYVVVSGRGRLETLNYKGHCTTELRPGDMQNSGLPVAGDAAMTFPPAYLSPETYPDAASLLDADGNPSPERTRAHRDLAIEGFSELSRQWRRGNRSAYENVCTAAVRLVHPRMSTWEKTVDDGALAAAHTALRQISALRYDDFDHLFNATVTRVAQPPRQTLRACDPVRRAGTAAEPQQTRWIERRHGRRQDRRWATSWSPEQIARRLLVDSPMMSRCASHTRICQARPLPGGRIRAEGGGREPADEIGLGLVTALMALVDEPDERGDPDSAGLDDEVAAPPGRGADPAGPPGLRAGGWPAAEAGRVQSAGQRQDPSKAPNTHHERLRRRGPDGFRERGPRAARAMLRRSLNIATAMPGA